MKVFTQRITILALGLASIAGAAHARSSSLANIAVRTAVANVTANVGSQDHGTSSALNVEANVGSQGRNSGAPVNAQAEVGSDGRSSGSLATVGASVGGLLGVKAEVGGAQETRCDFCGGGDGGVGSRQGW